MPGYCLASAGGSCASIMVMRCLNDAFCGRLVVCAFASGIHTHLFRERMFASTVANQVCSSMFYAHMRFMTWPPRPEGLNVRCGCQCFFVFCPYGDFSANTVLGIIVLLMPSATSHSTEDVTCLRVGMRAFGPVVGQHHHCLAPYAVYVDAITHSGCVICVEKLCDVISSVVICCKYCTANVITWTIRTPTNHLRNNPDSRDSQSSSSCQGCQAVLRCVKRILAWLHQH